jgi:hypothetical protein
MNMFRKFLKRRLSFITVLALVYAQQVQGNDSGNEYAMVYPQEISKVCNSDSDICLGCESTSFRCSSCHQNSCNERCCKEVSCCYLTFDSELSLQIRFSGYGEINGTASLNYLLTDPSGCSRLVQGISAPFNVTINLSPSTEDVDVSIAQTITTAKACCGSYQLSAILTINITSISNATINCVRIDPNGDTSLQVTTLCPKKIDVSNLMINDAQFIFPTPQMAGNTFIVRYDFPEYVFAPNCCILKDCCTCNNVK